MSVFSAKSFEEASQFDPGNFSEDTKRQLFYVGSKSLSDDEMKNLSSIISEMGSIYAQASSLIFDTIRHNICIVCYSVPIITVISFKLHVSRFLVVKCQKIEQVHVSGFQTQYIRGSEGFINGSF